MAISPSCNLDSLWCWQHLRFKKKHLLRISQALLLPINHRLSNNTVAGQIIKKFLSRCCSDLALEIHG